MKKLLNLLRKILSPSRRRDEFSETDSPEVYDNGAVKSTGDGVAKIVASEPGQYAAVGLAAAGYPEVMLALQLAALGYGIYQDQRSWNNMSPSSKESFRFQDDINDQNALDAYARQVKFQEAYLTPAAQLQSLSSGFEAVGLNKMGLVGVHPGASSSTAPQASPGSASEPSPVDVAGVIGQLVGAMQRSREIDISKSRVDADNQLSVARAEGQRIENSWRDRMLEAEYNERVANAEYVRQNTAKLFQDTKFAEIYAKYAPQLFDVQIAQGNAAVRKAAADVAKARSDISLNNAQIADYNSKIAARSKEVEKMDAEIMKIGQECITLASQAYLNDQLVAESEQRIKESEQRVINLGKQAGFTDLEIQYYLWNHAREYRTQSSENILGNGTSRSTTSYQEPGAGVPLDATPPIGGAPPVVRF